MPYLLMSTGRAAGAAAEAAEAEAGADLCSSVEVGGWEETADGVEEGVDSVVAADDMVGSGDEMGRSDSGGLSGTIRMLEREG